MNMLELRGGKRAGGGSTTVGGKRKRGIRLFFLLIGLPRSARFNPPNGQICRKEYSVAMGKTTHLKRNEGEGG